VEDEENIGVCQGHFIAKCERGSNESNCVYCLQLVSYYLHLGRHETGIYYPNTNLGKAPAPPITVEELEESYEEN
jgi:hypothetical protein